MVDNSSLIHSAKFNLGIKQSALCLSKPLMNNTSDPWELFHQRDKTETHHFPVKYAQN